MRLLGMPQRLRNQSALHTVASLTTSDRRSPCDAVTDGTRHQDHVYQSGTCRRQCNFPSFIVWRMPSVSVVSWLQHNCQSGLRHATGRETIMSLVYQQCDFGHSSLGLEGRAGETWKAKSDEKRTGHRPHSATASLATRWTRALGAAHVPALSVRSVPHVTIFVGVCPHPGSADCR
ncbi:hypothetical protein N658DRAFT_60862 [Parathielavia hyrcaniae]|uniref:Uncharacterized protein n=1 Tax=Parathielavia hyrcaniae TaxID=113614 RepID=A0AAN6T2B1_9PEZI|nr:hypothetical protein N658DRAFT_60862 [Parathielavia hyrcaniae]